MIGEQDNVARACRDAERGGRERPEDVDDDGPTTRLACAVDEPHDADVH